ncbi:cytochrome c oxidase assembly protein [Bosea rubneri]|uniref:Cytochrome c oxidase assembly protein n=1 Tax=Bosea rubneri TaxID=3075434 RepID=A0ABU3S6T6_9HYPH|nr:cytochrome c oxidase assembly protein [Bosea sp. ZW T0_25]MDU0340502.1 cytochrome c oxidase assembly protein [Bosea sp. ZW T0_25]
MHHVHGPSSSTVPVLAGALTLLVAGGVTLPLVEPGPLSVQMMLHLGLMNIVAPVIAVLLRHRFDASTAILPAGLAQMVALWAWHAPMMQQLAASSGLAQLVLIAGLGATAIWFWSAVIAAADWRALAALLLTGKLACLLGALMVFAPRDLYELPALALSLCATGPSTIADQHLAGLLMITACPLSYLVTGVALAARLLGRLDDSPRSDDATARAR